MALDEPKEDDHKFEQDGYTIVINPRVAAMAGDIVIEKHRWGGLFVRASNGAW